MSLLLDALKKAEKEKQKARESEKEAVADDDNQPGQEEVLESKADQSEMDQDEELHLETAENDLELTIDAPDVKEENSGQDSGSKTEQDGLEYDLDETSLYPPLELEKNTATNATVSDEALHLLVYKTNKKYQKKQKIIWGGLISVSVIILFMAGTYYYYGMLEEIEALERKHKIAMRMFNAEPLKSRQKVVPTKPANARKVIPAPKGKTKKVPLANKKVARPVTKRPVVEQTFSINKTRSVDPVNTLLRNAWLAYNKSDYKTASKAYEDVLKREPKNRDALLGMAAVAVKTSDYIKAKASYRLLLKLNPRDQVAMAAMSNISELSSDSQDESKLKFMLQQDPGATHLNFALGNYYAKKGRWPEAQSEYFKAWLGDSKNADYVYNLAVSLDQIGKTKEALKFYRESLLLGNGKNISFTRADVEKRIAVISVK